MYSSHYATKNDSKTETVWNTLELAKKTDLAGLKLDIDKLELLNKLNMMNWFKKLMPFQLLIVVIYLKKNWL